MQPISTRDDIKKDPLQEWLKAALEWVALNRQTFFSVVGTIAVALVVVGFMLANFKNLQKQGWEKYGMGQNWVYANKPDNALNFFNEVINDYGRTPAAIHALLAKGDVLHRQGKYAEAIQSYQECLNRNPEKIILPFVLSALGVAQEDSGDYAAAASTYKQFLAEYPDHYLASKMYESLARSYEAVKNPDSAKEIYEKIITMFPGTPWAEKARIRYQTLSPQPFQTAPGAAAPK